MTPQNGRSSETIIVTYKGTTYSKSSCQQWKNGTLLLKIHQEMVKLWEFKVGQCFPKILHASKDTLSPSFIFYSIAQLRTASHSFVQLHALVYLFHSVVTWPSKWQHVCENLFFQKKWSVNIISDIFTMHRFLSYLKFLFQNFITLQWSNILYFAT